MKFGTTTTMRASRVGMLLTGLALPCAGFAQDDRDSVDLDTYENDSYVSLKGTVESVSPDTFVLSYNESDDEVLVEMDDGDRDADAYQLLPGDRVTVYGVMDRDLFESRKIEASSVYVEKLNTFFQASAVDEEDYYYPLWTIITTPVDESDSSKQSADSRATDAGAQMSSPMPVLWLQGEVAEVENDSFQLAMGTREINVNVAELNDNPLDDEGYRKIAAGDVVSVRGNIDSGFFDDAELNADSVVKIHDKEDI